MSQLAVEKWLGIGGNSENEERVLIGFVCVLSDLETDTERRRRGVQTDNAHRQTETKLSSR